MSAHPAISYHLVQAKIAEIHQQARDDRLARDSRRNRRPRGHYGKGMTRILAEQVKAVFASPAAGRTQD